MIRFRYVDTPFGQMHVAEAGSGRPVVLLHQTPRSWDEYREVIELLAPDVRAIALDTVGMGASAALPGEHSIGRYAEAAGAACDALGVEQAVVVGHHTGGVIAIELAAQRTSLVEALVLSSTPWVDAASRERRRTRPPIDHVEVRADGSHVAELWRRRQAFYPPERPDLLHRFVRDALRVTDPEAGHRAVGEYRMEDRVGLVACPTLVLAHTDDPYAFPEHRALADRIPGAVVQHVDGGMVPLEWRAGAVADAIRAFVSSSNRG
jgi:pimeloyl-ACP methyl ester carboxylesterase